MERTRGQDSFCAIGSPPSPWPTTCVFSKVNKARRYLATSIISSDDHDGNEHWDRGFGLARCVQASLLFPTQNALTGSRVCPTV
jgi:hypothetical protein